MASFTETATLRVIDQSSAEIKKINKAISDMIKNAEKLKGVKGGNFGIDTSKLKTAESEVRKLLGDFAKLQGARANLQVNSSGIKQASSQIANLRNQAAKPITLRTALAAGAGALAGAGLAHKGLEAAKAGTRQVDIGETSLDLKMLSKEHRAFVDQQISDIGKEQAARKGGAMFNRGQIAQQYSEMLGTVNIGAAKTEQEFKDLATQAKFMADQNLELAGTLTKLGKSSEAARDDSVKFGKAIDLQAQIYDKTTGKIDPAKAAQAYNDVRALIPSIGAEMTGSNYLQLMKYLRSSKFALAPESTAIAMRNFEESGTSAAVGLNQFIKNLSGQARPAQLKEQERLGLRPKDKAEQEADQKLLREHPLQFTEEKIVPSLIKDLIAKGKTPEQAEAATFDPAYVATQMGKMFSDRTAQETATMLVLQRQEYRKFLADWESRRAASTLEGQRAATQYSVLGAGAAITAQTQGLAGELVRGVAPILVPVLGKLSEGARELADTVATATSGGPEAAAAQAKLAAGTVAGLTVAPR